MSTTTERERTFSVKLASKLSALGNPDCEACPLHQNTDRVCIPMNSAERWPKRDGKRLAMFIVGEAPGSNEEYTGKLFSGQAGQLLDKSLRRVGLKREWFNVTNAVRCRPNYNETPTPGQIRTCTGLYLGAEISTVLFENHEKAYGLILGNAGLRAVLSKSGITRHNGQVLHAFGVTWVAAFHPAAVLRNPGYTRQFLSALQVYSRLVKDEEGAPTTNVITVNDQDTLRRLISELEENDWGSIDLETWSPHPGHNRFGGGGLAWWDPDFLITTINFAFTPGTAYVLPLWHPQSRWKNPDKVLEILKPLIESTKWVMHNGLYDAKCLHRYNIRVNTDFDTMGATYALDENNRKDLGFLATVYLGADDYKDMVSKKDTRAVKLHDLAEYGGRDADYTLRLGKIINRELRAAGSSRRLYTKILRPAEPALRRVEEVGLPMDEWKFLERWDETINNLKETEEKILGEVGHEFNLRSPQQVGHVLYNELALPVIMSTKTGAPSTNEECLIRLMDYSDAPILQWMIDFRELQGRVSRYFEAWYALQERWRLHPHFKPYHTVTGRLSSENPNAQQIPRDPYMRGIIGGHPGWTFVEVDYSQIELRIVAHYTQDPTMMRAFHMGRDIHLETAMAVTGLPEQDITSEIRKKAKAVNFGYVYGMGWRKFKQYAKVNYGLDVSDEEAQESRRVFFDLFRGIIPWHERQRKAVNRRGWVISALGRRRNLPDVHSTNKEVKAEAERQAINSPVQSLASDMMLISMTKLLPMLKWNECRIVSTVHDALLFEVDEAKLDKYLTMIVDTMTNLPLEREYGCLLTIPIEVEVKVGSHWSEGAHVVDVG
jgi:uracil-DNA glycosylase family 4